MRKFFFNRSQRERVLLTLFSVAVLIWWSAGLAERIDFALLTWSETGHKGKEQTALLARRTEVEERMQRLSARFDPARTLNATQAFAEINRLAQGLSVELGAPRTERTDNIAMHSLQATVRRTDLRNLVNFYQALSAKAPYLGIDQCSITTERGTPGQITAVFKLYSVEVITTPTP